MKMFETIGLPAEFIDLRETADLSTQLPVWLDAIGERLINRSSTTWRNLSAADKARAATDTVGLVLDYPALIKRPVIDAAGRIFCGLSAEVQAALRG